MWDKVVQRFESRYRVVRFDLRGHGKSSTPPGPYSVDDLGRDVVLLIDSLGIASANYCGLSLGGMIGIWLGIHASERLARVVLANTAPRIGSPSAWDERIATLRREGIKPLAEATLTRWFTASYRTAHADEVDFIRRMLLSTDPNGYSACCAALRDADLTSGVASISTPCLVITGESDPATPPSDGRALHQQLGNSEYVELEASHLSAWERADDFARVALSFLGAGRTSNG
jgi:3-oxoadipate enol-lactonase